MLSRPTIMTVLECCHNCDDCDSDQPVADTVDWLDKNLTLILLTGTYTLCSSSPCWSLMQACDTVSATLPVANTLTLILFMQNTCISALMMPSVQNRPTASGWKHQNEPNHIVITMWGRCWMHVLQGKASPIETLWLAMCQDAYPL